MAKGLPTDPYKGVRDFYPQEMAIQRYIFDIWTQVAESYGFERYDSSVLEPAALYKSKGAENEELVNEQTYTFTDRGDREVTLRPEMTPSVARMVAGKRRELAFPIRWYSIPSLYRYERMQRGRLREHWQLNCDIFGSNEYIADVEIIALAHNIMIAFGASPDMFEIRINDREWLQEGLKKYNLGEEQTKQMIALIDRKDKIDNFDEEAQKIAGQKVSLDVDAPPKDSNLAKVIEGLSQLGIKNVVVSPSTVRGFAYYTGTIFEIFDISGENNRSLLGGGRYDNLTALFGGDPIPGVGFGMGDVTMRDFLETHNLLTSNITSPTLVIIPTDSSFNVEAQAIAQKLRIEVDSVAVDFSDRKLGKKISSASEALVEYVLVVGEDEIKSQTFTLKRLIDGEESSGTLESIVSAINS